MLSKNRNISSIETPDESSSVISLTHGEVEGIDVPKGKSSGGDFQDRDCVNIYLHQIGKIPLLKPEEELYLFRIIQEGRKSHWNPAEQDRVYDAKTQVIKGNLRLVAKLAVRYRNLGLPFLDLIQEGNVGLMKAVEKFDPERGYRFTTYATWWIQQSIMRALTDHGRTIRLPAHIVERLSKLNRSREYLQQRNNKQPTIEEVAADVSLPIEKVRQTLEFSQELASLDMPLDDEDDRNSFIDLVQSHAIPSPEDEIAAKAVREQLDEVLETLLPREAEVLKLRFGLIDGTAYTLEQLGQSFGITRERVRQIEKKALMKLRHPKRSIKLKDFME